jgi:hypothetical protein
MLLNPRQSKDANMSMERALRSITSPRKSALKKSRKSVDNKNEESVKGEFLFFCLIVLSLNVTQFLTTALLIKQIHDTVAIRIRPIGSNSSNESTTRAFRAINNSVIEDSKHLHLPSTTPRRHSHGDIEHTYDNVFGEEVDTSQIYTDLLEDIVRL